MVGLGLSFKYSGLDLDRKFGSPLISCVPCSRSACVFTQLFLWISVAKPNTFERLFYEN